MSTGTHTGTHTGTVKFFNEEKGFGFIEEQTVAVAGARRPAESKDHFVHASGLIHEIQEGDNVEFELEEGKKGLNAVKVRIIE
jgi:CspA family cold shock protein